MTIPKAKHSKLGASIAKRWLNCPGSVKACEGFPNVGSKAADEGTAAHEMAELALKSGVVGASHLVGKTAANGVPFTKEMAKAVDVYIREVWRAVVPTKDNPVQGKMLIEHKFHLHQFDEMLFGTNDALVRRGDVLHVFDYKHGAGVFVDEKDNPQTKYYGLGALMHPELGLGVRRVLLTIVQPRCFGEAVRTFEIDPLDLFEFGADLRDGAARTREPDAQLKAGDWCRFCPAAAVCNAHRKTALQAAAADFADIETPTPKLAPPAAMSLEEMAKRYEFIPQLELWLNQFKAHCMASALGGQPPAGYKLVHGRGSRSWKNPSNAMREIAEKTDLGEDDLFETKPISVAEAEKLIGKAEFKAFVDLVDKKLGGPALAPVTSEKPDFKSDSNSVFDDVSVFEAE